MIGEPSSFQWDPSIQGCEANAQASCNAGEVHFSNGH